MNLRRGINLALCWEGCWDKSINEDKLLIYILH